MTRNSFRFIALTVATVLFWLSVIAFFMYVPRIIQVALPQQRVINVISWVDYISPDDVADFEKETGITVYVNYYENTDELLSKLEASSDQYDMAVATNTVIPEFMYRDLLKPIDKDKLNFLPELDKRLQDLPYDPGNQFSIPFFWDIMGLGINEDVITPFLQRHGWGLLFNPLIRPRFRVGMTNDPREIISLAAQYSFGEVDQLDTSQQHSITQTLMQQKNWVEAYTELRGEFLLYSGTAPVAMLPSAQMYPGVQSGRFTNFKFLIPDDAFMLIDTVVVLNKSVVNDDVYTFINFLYQKRIMEGISSTFGFLPARSDVLAEFDTQHMIGLDVPLAQMPTFDDFRLFKKIISYRDLMKIWLAVKAK